MSLDDTPSPDASAPATVARRAPVLWVAVAVLAGYICAEVWPHAPVNILAGISLVLAAAALALAIFAPRPEFRPRKLVLGWSGLFLIAGILLAWSWHEARVRTPATEWAALPPREAKLTLRITRDFAISPTAAIYANDTTYAGGLAEVVNAPDVFAELRGATILYRVRVNADDIPPPRGATIEVKGVLDYLPTLALDDPANPVTPSTARFRAYVHAQGAWFELSRGILQHTVSPPNAWMLWLETQRAHILDILGNGPKFLESSYGNEYKALVVGDASLLDPTERTAYTVSGGIYLFALSGLHIAILAAALWWVLRKIPRLPHFVGELLTLMVAWLYVEIAGGTTSGHRAALMLTFYLVGKWLGRGRSPLAAVLAAGVATLIVDPLALDNSGFELSYSVVLGLILYAPLLWSALQARWRPWRDVPALSLAPWQKTVLWIWDRLTGLAVTSWTAVLCSTPLTAEFSGTFSANTVVFNLIFFPLACATLWSGAIAVAVGIFGMPPFIWLAWIVNAVGLSLIGLMQTLAGIAPPRLSTNLEIIPPWAGSIAALAVLAVMLLAQPKNRLPRWWYFALPVIILELLALLSVRLLPPGLQ